MINGSGTNKTNISICVFFAINNISNTRITAKNTDIVLIFFALLMIIILEHNPEISFKKNKTLKIKIINKTF